MVSDPNRGRRSFSIRRMTTSSVRRPGNWSRAGSSSRHKLQDCLRQRWPLALVRPRELAGEQAQIWYVYRDGHWVQPGR